MLGLKVNDAKSFFFDRPTVDSLDKDAMRGLSRFGAFVRRDARKSIRKAKQKTLAEMSKSERRRFYIRQSIAKSEGGPKPRKPLATSNPGEPPRSQTGLLKQHIYFIYEPQSRGVLIGPADLNRSSGAPETLEKGGHVKLSGGRFRIEPRPYMKPAFDKNIDNLPRMLLGQ